MFDSQIGNHFQSSFRIYGAGRIIGRVDDNKFGFVTDFPFEIFFAGNKAVFQRGFNFNDFGAGSFDDFRLRQPERREKYNLVVFAAKSHYGLKNGKFGTG